MGRAVRVGLIGAGRWGQVYIRTLSSFGERCRMTHLCTSRPERASLIGHPVQVTADWRGVVASDCEAVIIATPPQTHAKIVEACLDAGKPCLVEKPLCLDFTTAQRLQERIRVSTTPVLVNHTHLFTPAYHALKEHLRRAEEPVRALLSEGMGFGPFRTDTSALWDWGPHDLSLCLDLVGEAPAAIETLGVPHGLNSPPDLVSLRLGFPGGACAWVQTGRLSPWKRRTLSVFTDRRLYVWEDGASQPLTASSFDYARRDQGGAPEQLERTPVGLTSRGSPMENMLAYFVDGLAGEERIYFGTELALDITRVLDACEKAITQKR